MARAYLEAMEIRQGLELHDAIGTRPDAEILLEASLRCGIDDARLLLKRLLDLGYGPQLLPLAERLRTTSYFVDASSAFVAAGRTDLALEMARDLARRGDDHALAVFERAGGEPTAADRAAMVTARLARGEILRALDIPDRTEQPASPADFVAASRRILSEPMSRYSLRVRDAVAGYRAAGVPLEEERFRELGERHLPAADRVACEAFAAIGAREQLLVVAEKAVSILDTIFALRAAGATDRLRDLVERFGAQGNLYVVRIVLWTLRDHESLHRWAVRMLREIQPDESRAFLLVERRLVGGSEWDYGQERWCDVAELEHLGVAGRVRLPLPTEPAPPRI